MSHLATRALWSIKAKTPVTSVASLGFCSRRLLHSTGLARSENKDTTTEAAASTEATAQDGDAAEATEEAPSAGSVIATKLPFRRKRFHQWLLTEGERFKSPSFSGVNYVGEGPFPMNPLFKPTPPLSNMTKDEIYKLHMSDTSKWTPRQLGTKFNISIKRVEAVLRLKHLEQEMIANGFVAQENFTKGMEQLMGVKHRRTAEMGEPLTDILPQVGSPKFATVDEEDQFTPEDAAKVLKRRPLAEIKAIQLEEERMKPFKLVDSVNGVFKKVAPKTVAVSRNASETSPRFKYSIVDTSKTVKV
ncbi:hypothetical protein BGW38_005302 [Lunasporangiospora selenospora]|uniref:Eukaryotic mitochondrial regulator protein-domain-containing protein n=1 Tax=Lunasporangiospora selenospora TaxID=979761 RepID=A0A9P6FP13_9FUNG|nr:hypothetical protein BGW38_005302 [Lunasporangiospora selenospora]